MVWRVIGGIGLGAWLLGGCESVPLSDPEARCGDLGNVAQPLTGTCTQKALQPVADPGRGDFGQVPCRVATVAALGSAACDCGAASLLPADSALASFAHARVQEMAQCSADQYCFCELPQLSGADLAYCWDVEAEARPFDEQPVGWCYVDPDAGFGNPELVSDCHPRARRLIRLLPVRGSWNIVLACQG